MKATVFEHDVLLTESAGGTVQLRTNSIAEITEPPQLPEDVNQGWCQSSFK